MRIPIKNLKQLLERTIKTDKSLFLNYINPRKPTLSGAENMTPWTIIKSGTKQTVKNSLPIAQVLQSIRKPQPMKGIGNPKHLQQNFPKSMNKPGA